MTRGEGRVSVSFVTVPGIDGSGPDHWQTQWERSEPAFARFQPASWSAPELEDWCRALETAVARAATPVLVAHSLGCLLVAHWAARPHAAVAGAFLVSVPDPEAPAFPAVAAGFERPPRDRLPFPSLVVSSTTDPFGGLGHQACIAADWGAGHVLVGDAGHVNGASGLGRWRAGRDLLTCFVASLGAA